MVYASARCRLPKLRVLAGLLRGRRWQEGELFCAPDEIPREAADALHAYHASVGRRATMRPIVEVAGRFTVPGGRAGAPGRAQAAERACIFLAPA